MLDLRPDLESLRKGLEFRWRNKVNRAEKTHAAHVQVQADMARVLDILLHEREMRQERGFHGLPLSFVPAYIEAHAQPVDAFLVSSVVVDGEVLAGMLFLLHGRVATYHMGWNSSAGRQRGLHNLALWKSLPALKARGVEKLDMGAPTPTICQASRASSWAAGLRPSRWPAHFSEPHPVTGWRCGHEEPAYPQACSQARCSRKKVQCKAPDLACAITTEGSFRIYTDTPRSRYHGHAIHRNSQSWHNVCRPTALRDPFHTAHPKTRSAFYALD